MLSSLYSTQRFNDSHTHGIPSKQAYGFVPNPPDNLGHVDPSSQNLMTGKYYVEGNDISLEPCIVIVILM